MLTGPRTTGDGYCESYITTLESNQIGFTV